jgi:glycosyltransferase involved in cell wall biosynthesis
MIGSSSAKLRGNKNGTSHYYPVMIVLSGNFDAVGGLQIYLKNFVEFMKNRGLIVTVVHRPNVFAHRYANSQHSRQHMLVEKSAGLHPALRYLLTFFTFCFFGSLHCFKIIRKSSIDLIHAQDTGYAGIVGLVVSKFTNKPLILHVHGKLWAESSSGKYSIYERTIGRFIASNSARIIFVSESLKLYYQRMGVNPSKMLVLSTGVDFASFNNRNGFDSARKTSLTQVLKVGYVGRLDSIKNVESLIRGFAEASRSSQGRLSLTILGDGPEREKLENLARSQNISVVFKGFVTNVAEELSGFDIFVLPSFSEGCPLSLLEAMASGKAIIASNIPSIREIARHEKEALLVNPYNVGDFHQALLLLSDDSELRTRLGSNAKKRAELYDTDIVYKKLLAIYEQTILYNA